MSQKLKNGIIFLAGFAVGAASAFAYFKAKVEKEFAVKQEEMIRYYKEKKLDKKEEEEVEENVDDVDDSNVKEENIKEMNHIINRHNYSKISEKTENTKNLSPSLNDDFSETPYEIDPREFGSQEMYGMATFYLYDDGEILTDKYELLDDETIDSYIGAKNLEKLANLRDQNPDLDSYYIRNDRLKIDCEIIIGAENIDEEVVT